ncbi:hypothetical protein J6590_093372 [Homalodisca vitripennis]|nr:hypothetical protein J6590_093372 [Homalodisca vitripennis]
MAVNGFECLLNDPTRITADTATCIDHVFARVSRVDMMSVEADVEHAGITDHSLVRAGDGGGGPASPAPAKANRTDYDKLNRLLVCADWADVYRQSDADVIILVQFHPAHNPQLHSRFCYIITEMAEIQGKGNRNGPFRYYWFMRDELLKTIL